MFSHPLSNQNPPDVARRLYRDLSYIYPTCNIGITLLGKHLAPPLWPEWWFNKICRWNKYTYIFSVIISDNNTARLSWKSSRRGRQENKNLPYMSCQQRPTREKAAYTFFVCESTAKGCWDKGLYTIEDLQIGSYLTWNTSPTGRATNSVCLQRFNF